MNEHAIAQSLFIIAWKIRRKKLTEQASYKNGEEFKASSPQSKTKRQHTTCIFQCKMP